MRLILTISLTLLMVASAAWGQDEDPVSNWNETFYDSSKDLYWTNQLTEEITYRDGLDACARVNVKGPGRGWRLPGTVELQALHSLAIGERGQWKPLKADINRNGCVNEIDKGFIELGTQFPTPCRGDLNGDLVVDQRDIAVWESENGTGCGGAPQSPHPFDINFDGIVNFSDESRAMLFMGQANVTFCEGDLNGNGSVSQSEVDSLRAHAGECAGGGHNCANRGNVSASCGTTFLSKAACETNPSLWILSQVDEELAAPSSFNLSGGTEEPISLVRLSGLRCVRRGDGGLPELPKRQAWRAVAGDGNRDGVINLDDLNNVRNNFGASGESPVGDGNQDGMVNLVDLNDVRNQFGYILPPPEPPFYRGDANCDRKFDGLDLEAVNLIVSDRPEHDRRFPGCTDDNVGDMNCDGYYNEDDIYYVELALEDEEYYERAQTDCGVLVGR